MPTFLVTGGTGFLGRHILPLLLARVPDARIHVLVRAGSVDRLTDLAAGWLGGDRIHPLVGDLTAPGLGLGSPPPAADHLLHLGAIYDLTAGDEQAATNVDGTRAVIDLADRLGATLHHVSSIAVAGDHRGTFTEADFDLGQSFPTPYHRTKFEAEKLVRDRGAAWRIYRPAAVVGDSVTGEMDKVDGPYYLFPTIAALAALPARLPVAVPNLGATNIVPVDYVAHAVVELMMTPGRDGEVFHLVNPRPQPIREIYAALAAAAGAPHPVADLPALVAAPVLRPPGHAATAARNEALRRLGIPPVILDHLALPTTFDSTATRAALHGTGITVPPFGSYADTLWRYWRGHLDPDRHRRPDPAGPLVGRHVLITGGSSGIGRATATAVAAKGARVLLIARGAADLDATVTEIRDAGGDAHGYPCDLTDDAAVTATVARILADHDHVDMLVNNAGRSIRRGVYASTGRVHDYERTMAVNYFGAVRLVLALLPGMRDRRFGHIVNISTAGVQGRTPRFSAYVASKSALDGFTDTVAAETLSDGITFTTIHMPLVHTPMIAPSGRANVGRVLSPGHAAAMVVRALVERPKRIDVPLGTLGEFGNLFAPATKDRILHRLYLAYPDSPAARGQAPAAPDTRSPVRAAERHRRSAAARACRRLARLVPGTHW
ncbi:SDR family oxidoreductase [Rhodococcus sp. NPDC058505]|uniref:SDR family oxidoreductase n=1 Tax=unclassified Rhodococcus (in: high G+C Gram-positive bacteria) TaxID=192944 RepID=UPI0036677F4F